MDVNFNPMFRRIEFTARALAILITISLLTFVATGVELLFWRSIALSVAISLTTFLTYPLARGIRKGDLIYVPIWREIDTPGVSESYIDNIPTIALEDGRKNQRIKVQLWDGSMGLVHLLHYGLISQAEGKLVEAECSGAKKKCPQDAGGLDE